MPAATPDPIVARLNRELTAILDAPDTRETMQKHGFEPETGTPALVTERIRSETEKWRALVAKTGIKAE